jgi:exportin-1
MLPLNTNIPEAYACGQDQEQNFIQNLAMFLCTYLKEHSALVEKDQLHEVLMKVRKLLLSVMLCICIVSDKN